MNKKKIKPRTLIVENDIFKCEVLFVWDCSHKELEKELKSRKILGKDANLDDLETADGSQPTFYDDNGIYRVLWLKKWGGKPDDYGRLAHEVTHLVVRIMDWKGIPFDGHKNNDETFAYMADYYVRSFLKGK